MIILETMGTRTVTFSLEIHSFYIIFITFPDHNSLTYSSSHILDKVRFSVHYCVFIAGCIKLILEHQILHILKNYVSLCHFELVLFSESFLPLWSVWKKCLKLCSELYLYLSFFTFCLCITFSIFNKTCCINAWP